MHEMVLIAEDNDFVLSQALEIVSPYRHYENLPM